MIHERLLVNDFRVPRLTLGTVNIKLRLWRNWDKFQNKLLWALNKDYSWYSSLKLILVWAYGRILDFLLCLFIYLPVH